MSSQLCYIRDCVSQSCGGDEGGDANTKVCQHRGGGSGNREIASHTIQLQNSTFSKKAQPWINDEWGNGGMADGDNTTGSSGTTACAWDRDCGVWPRNYDQAYKSTYCEHKTYTEDPGNCCLGYVAQEDNSNFPLLGENYLTIGEETIASSQSEKDPHLAVCCLLYTSDAADE